jgi:hypothetical protein
MKPIKPLRERKKPGSLTQAELYAQVKDSTERNRQFFFIWIAFALYVIVTTIATTDLQLLLPNSTVTLPALGIQLPLIGFFLVTPWLLLILHFNLLQNLDSHANKLMQWANTYPDQTPPRAALPAFLFDFAMLEQGGVFAKLTQVAAQLVFYAVGPLTIGILLWRFSDYQSWQYTTSQATAFFISIYFVVTAILALNRKHRLKVALSEFNYWVVYVPIIAVVVFQTIWVIVLAFQMGKSSRFHEYFPEVWKPTINLAPYTSIAKISTDMQTRMALDGETDLVEWLKKHGICADLNNRNLKYAQLPGADLRQTQLLGADLHGANLMGAFLQNAHLIGQQLQNTNLSNAHLEGANLINANLKEAHLIYTFLQGADLRTANLSGADLSGIIVDAKTKFAGSKTDPQTQIFVYETNYSSEGLPDLIFIDSTKTFELRNMLRSNNELVLPDILYEQLFATPQGYYVKNSKGKVEEKRGIGLRDSPKK